MTDLQKITAAWYGAQDRRPYRADDALTRALTPDGGDWQCVIEGDRRLVTWNGVQAALVNPQGSLHDVIARDIAMALTAAPQMDKALRVIMVLAEDPANLDLIRRICVSAVAHVERPAPRFPGPEQSDDEDDIDIDVEFDAEDVGERP